MRMASFWALASWLSADWLTSSRCWCSGCAATKRISAILSVQRAFQFLRVDRPDTFGAADGMGNRWATARPTW